MEMCITLLKEWALKVRAARMQVVPHRRLSAAAFFKIKYISLNVRYEPASDVEDSSLSTVAEHIWKLCCQIIFSLLITFIHYKFPTAAQTRFWSVFWPQRWKRTHESSVSWNDIEILIYFNIFGSGRSSTELSALALNTQSHYLMMNHRNFPWGPFRRWEIWLPVAYEYHTDVIHGQGAHCFQHEWRFSEMQGKSWGESCLR